MERSWAASAVPGLEQKTDPIDILPEETTTPVNSPIKLPQNIIGGTRIAYPVPSSFAYLKEANADGWVLGTLPAPFLPFEQFPILSLGGPYTLHYSMNSSDQVRQEWTAFLFFSFCTMNIVSCSVSSIFCVRMYVWDLMYGGDLMHVWDLTYRCDLICRCFEFVLL